MELRSLPILATGHSSPIINIDDTRVGYYLGMHIESLQPDRCRTRLITNTRLFYCGMSGELSTSCQFALMFGDDFLCLHPENHLRMHVSK